MKKRASFVFIPVHHYNGKCNVCGRCDCAEHPEGEQIGVPVAKRHKKRK